jgi:D-alanine transaminase
MSRFVYVNGRYRRYADACVHVEDRGFQFADAVYEVIEVSDGQLIDTTRHLDRLGRSLEELSIGPVMPRGALLNVIRQTVHRNRVRDGLVYLQISRGVSPRDFLFSSKSLTPTVVCLARSVPRRVREAKAQRGIRVVTMPDIRWKRCDIKTVMLLPAVLAKERAREVGADEAWLIDQDGFVTEGASSNAWIVSADGKIQTRSLSNSLLSGVTRRTVLDVAAALGLQAVEAPFTVANAQAAVEAFGTSASATILPVVEIDGVVIGGGRPGAITQKLREVFHQHAEQTDTELSLGVSLGD